ncbi:MAG: methyltransferase domain-containing protein [Myxococcota bacterium]|nr:methyltransferase domain-containing protein [Myxococcota bacterium]MDW8362343.1 methyltransferase domain-containing protein [Myxococcales bacterium]
MTTRAPYFTNHARRRRWPWRLYHGPIERALARIVRAHTGGRGLVVGCGLEPFVPGAERALRWHGCDLDPDAIAACEASYPAMRGRLAVCPDAYTLPSVAPFDGTFDVVVAKEVIEHVEEPERFARALASRVAPGGDLVLSTPDYGFPSTLGLLEATVLEWIARREGWSRAYIHPSPMTAARLAALDLGPDVSLVRIRRVAFGWALVACWRREVPQPGAGRSTPSRNEGCAASRSR